VKEISHLLAKTAPDTVLPGDDKQLPFPRNPYFTGREELLTQLHKTFLSPKHAASRAFPPVTHETRLRSDRLLPHAQACAALITDYDFTFPEAARLLNRTGVALEGRASYSDAIPLLQRALAINEKVLGPDHPDTAEILNNLAGLYESQGNYPAALPLLQRALSIYEKVLGPDHPTTAIVRGNYTSLQERTTAPPNAQKSVSP
jgi:tetratricopeptide (TPR) repeat protein